MRQKQNRNERKNETRDARKVDKTKYDTKQTEDVVLQSDGLHLTY